MSIVIALLIFSVIVIIHEIGHFLAARWCGVLVEEFAVGMGPRLLSTKKGDTVYSLRMFPIGGFCAMLGDNSETDKKADPRSFSQKTVWQRFVIMAAGAFMNFVLAFLVFTGLTFVRGISEPVVRVVQDGSPAMQAGLQPGDRIVKIGGKNVRIYEDLAFNLNSTKGRSVDMVIQRDGIRLDKTITPVWVEDDENYMLMIGLDYKTGLLQERDPRYPRADIWGSMRNGFWRISFYIKVTLYGLSQLITMNVSPDEISGPVGIVNTIGQSFSASVARGGTSAAVGTMLMFCAILSANLGVMNLLPLPALDGGRLLFVIIEFIRRKPVPPEREGLVHFAGFVALMVLSAAIAYNDIVKLLFR